MPRPSAAVLAVTAAVLASAGFAGPAHATASRPAKTTNGPCAYAETPDQPAARKSHLPKDPHRTPAGTDRATLRTNHGDITLTLDADKAGCTVQSFLHLVRHKFYDQTSCHRLTAYRTLKVLQCGDPGGTGEGGPGYQYKDELPTDLPPVPGRPGVVFYPRGTLAMANAGPDTNGSQFFLVYADSMLRPNYTVFGQVDADGMAALDAIAAGGVQPTPENPAPADGAPALPANILDARH
ncbi:peptidylprolyl isomerase [Longispora albida]|uniref:peptidylprolyl isomerase n=1 Tax=Longispora albida TaxID=203523 RepID=UPI00039E9866|nr:peptidylprolyl isomerase [Longispora albida]